MAEDELRDLDVDACIVQARGAGVAAIVREVLAREELERIRRFPDATAQAVVGQDRLSVAWVHDEILAVRLHPALDDREYLLGDGDGTVFASCRFHAAEYDAVIEVDVFFSDAQELRRAEPCVAEDERDAGREIVRVLPEDGEFVVIERLMLAAYLIRRQLHILCIVDRYDLAVDGKREELVAERLHHLLRAVSKLAGVKLALYVAGADVDERHIVQAWKALIGGNVGIRNGLAVIRVCELAPFLIEGGKGGRGGVNVVGVLVVVGKGFDSFCPAFVVTKILLHLLPVIRPFFRYFDGIGLAALAREFCDRAVSVWQSHDVLLSPWHVPRECAILKP